MDGLLGSQLSDNDWLTPAPQIRAHIQDASTTGHTGVQSSILQGLEAQMAQHEREYVAHLEDLAKLYVIPTDGSVTEFLNDHRAVPQILIAGLPHLRKHFPDAVLALRTTSDEFGWENLYVDVLWPGDALEAFRLLDQFGDDWWIANSLQARGALTFTYRLV